MQHKWFGGAGVMDETQVRYRIVRTMNFIERELHQGLHFVYPADGAQSSACLTGAVAYVWRASWEKPTEYEETRGPRCHSSDDPFKKNCGLDEHGRYYVYLCHSWKDQGEPYQVGVLLHEATHHAGPNDVTGSPAQAKRNNQHDQLMNAANYQYFAQDVFQAESGCLDLDHNCAHYKREGYCATSDHIRTQCQWTCALCEPNPAPPPPPAAAPPPAPSQPAPAPPPAPRPPPCVDSSSWCPWYTPLCGLSRVQVQCRRTCGLCCVDSYEHCQWYRDNGYCSTENVRKQCSRTCGLC